jgi:transaldolase
LGTAFTNQLTQLPSQSVLDEIDRAVNVEAMEKTLMSEGTAKFADPHNALLKLIAEKRAALAG